MSTFRTQVRLLGPIEVHAATGPVAIGGRHPRTVLAMLAAAGGDTVSVDRLADAVWAADAVRRSRTTLQVHVSNLRKALASTRGRDVIVAAGDGYRLDTSAVSIDATEFTSQLQAAASTAASGDLQSAKAALDAALALWRGAFAADLDDVEALEGERTRLAELRLGAEEDRADTAIRLGMHAQMLAELGKMCTDEPLRERRWGLLMVARYRSGDQGGALDAYRRAREVLVEELGIDPGPALQRLERSVLAQSDSLMVPDATRCAAIVWLDTDGAPRQHLLLPERSPVRLGRDPDRCDVAFAADPAVSRLHAEIRHDGSRWLLADDSVSSNGTFVNGERAGAGTPLADGDLVRLGDSTLRLRLPDTPGPQRSAFGGDTVLAPGT